MAWADLCSQAGINKQEISRKEEAGQGGGEAESST
jgi:hypothetical protein